MKEKINIDINTIKIIYGRYRKHIFFIFTILVCFILFLTIIIPKINELSALIKNAKTEADELVILKSKLDLLSRADDATLDSQLKLVSRALPVDKDFEGILNAVSLAAIKSGVSLSDYEFQVGDLSQVISNTSGFPSLRLSLNTASSPKQTLTFVNELNKSLPLSEITSIGIGGNSSSIMIIFYYKQIPKIEYDDKKPIKEVSEENLKLIRELSSWNYDVLPNSFTSPPSPPSGSSVTSPF